MAPHATTTISAEYASLMPSRSMSFVGHVRELRISRDAVLLDDTDHLLSAILAGDRIDHDIGAGLTQGDRHGLADTGICPVTRAFCQMNCRGIDAADFGSAVVI
jgi:hypothetical protein